VKKKNMKKMEKRKKWKENKVKIRGDESREDKCASDEGLTPTKDEDTCLRRLSMFRKEVH